MNDSSYTLVMLDTSIMDFDSYVKVLIEKIGVKDEVAKMLVDLLNKQGFIKVFTGTKNQCYDLAHTLPLKMIPVRLERDNVQTFIFEEMSSVNSDSSTIEIIIENNLNVDDKVYLGLLMNLCEHNIDSAKHVLSEVRQRGESIAFIRDCSLAFPIIKSFKYENIPTRHSFFLMSDEEKGNIFP